MLCTDASLLAGRPLIHKWLNTRQDLLIILGCIDMIKHQQNTHDQMCALLFNMRAQLQAVTTKLRLNQGQSQLCKLSLLHVMSAVFIVLIGQSTLER